MAQRLAYVTGGMGGIGTAICQRLHKEGSRSSQVAARRATTRSGLPSRKPAGYTFYTSVATSRTGIRPCRIPGGQGRAWAGRCAGEQCRHHPRRMFRKMTRADWDAVINTNLNSLFNVTKQVVDDMLDRGWGRIINISSVNGQKASSDRPTTPPPRPGSTAHHGTRAGGRNQRRHGEHRVTRLHRHRDGPRDPPDVLEKIVGTIPVKRLGTPEEIGSIVAWLASDDSGFSTGADFSLNGGLHMADPWRAIGSMRNIIGRQ